MVSVARETVNMRSAPGTRSTVQWALSRGYPLQVVARKGAWLRVRDFEGGSRLGAALADGAHAASCGEGEGGQPARRAGQACAHRRQGQLRRRAAGTLERKGDWVRVQRTNGGSGWVARRLLWGW